MAQTAQPADITAVQSVLKEVWTSDRIESQLYEDNILMSQLDSTSDYTDSVGSRAVVPLRIGRNVGTSARSLNGGTLGAPGHQQYARAEYDYTANYVQIKILGGTIAKMKTARQSAVRAIDSEVTGALNDLKKELTRQLYGDGTAIIAGTATGGASTTVVLDTATLKGADAIDRGWLQVGEYIDIGTTGAEASVVADARITAVTPNSNATAPYNASITIDSSVSTTSGTHFISKSDNRSGTTSYEMNGLANMISATGSFGNVNPSTVPQWASPTIAAGANLSRAQLQRTWRKIKQNGGSDNLLVVTSLDHQEDYYNLLQAQVRFAGDANLASGKVDGPLFNGTPLVGDPDCPRGVVYFIDKAHAFMFNAGDIAWQNVNTGGDILAWKQDEDAFVARAAVYQQLGTDRRVAHGKLTGVQVASAN